MANRVTIRIHNQNYNILAEEDPNYIQQCADVVKRELDQAMGGTTLSITDGAVLACLNLADKLGKERQVSDNLRAQLKEALDENARLKRSAKRAKVGKTPPKAEPIQEELVLEGQQTLPPEEGL